jgi:3alpha(or 20beta)-hydroxysteroid dehydrogenase
MGLLDGKVAIVTGGARGMGATHVRKLAKEGAKVIISDLDEESGEQLAEEIGEQAIFVKHDVTNLDDWNNIISKGKEAFGSINVLVNNAGISGPRKDITELEVDDYLKTINVDQHGVFYGMKAVIPHMIESGGGSIVNIASVAGIRHVSGTRNVAYTAAKHAVIGLTKSGAVEYAGRNIKINAVCPGAVLTPLMKEIRTEEQLEELGKAAPAGRFGETEEISEAVIFLASDRSSYINGQYILVDGGLAAR